MKTSINHLIFIDSHVADWERLASNEGADSLVIRLDAQTNGVSSTN